MNNLQEQAFDSEAMTDQFAKIMATIIKQEFITSKLEAGQLFLHVCNWAWRVMELHPEWVQAYRMTIPALGSSNALDLYVEALVKIKPVRMLDD